MPWEWYTIVLMYPDYASDENALYVDWALAADLDIAIGKTRRKACKANNWSIPPEDFAFKLAFKGKQRSIV